jgi:hypothetical protein
MSDNQSDPRFKAWVLERAPRSAPAGLVARAITALEAEPRRRSRRWSALGGLAFVPAAAAVVVVGLLGALVLLPRTPAAFPGESATPAPSSSTTPMATPAASTTFAPPTVPEPSSADLAAELPYFCGNGELFHIESLAGPADATEGSDPAAAPVQPIATRLGLAATHWWLVYRSDTTAEYLGAAGPGHYEYVITTLKEGGGWVFKGLGDCDMRYLIRGFSTLKWWVDPANPPTPGARDLHVIAVDPCQPAPLVGRVGTPVVRYGVDSVLIVLTATQGPNSDVCGNGPRLALTVALSEPIGDRMLIDGGVWPSRDASVAP